MKIKSLHKIIPGEKLKVCAYARISNDKEELESSFDEQVSYYTSVILENPSWDFSGIYADKGISGTTINERKQFLRMIENAKNGFIDIILVKSVSRFSRNLIDLLTIVRDLRKIGVEIYFEQQNMSSLDTTCDQMITLYADFAEEEAKSVSQNVRWRNEKNRRDGVYRLPTGQMKGYRYNEAGEVEIIEEDAKFIRKIFEMYVANYSACEIADYLKEAGFKTVTGKDTWCSTSIRSILRNEKYVGDCLLQKEYNKDCIDHKRYRNYGEKDQYLITNGHPAIVDRDLWNKAQEILSSRCTQFKIFTGRHEDVPDWKPSPYAGFVYCPYCHSNYRLRTNHYNGIKTKQYLTCGSNQERKTCKNDNVFIEQFNDSLIKEIHLLKDNLQALKRALIQEFSRNETNTQETEIEATQRQINALRLKLEKLNLMHDEFAEALKKEIEDNIIELTKTKMKLQSDLLLEDSAENRANDVISALKKIPAEFKSIDDIQFKEIFSRAIVKDKEHLIFIIGNPDVSGFNLKTSTLFSSKIEYTIRRTKCILNFGIVINK